MKIEVEIPDYLVNRFKKTTAHFWPGLPLTDSVVKRRLAERIESAAYNSITNWALEAEINIDER